MKKRERFWPLYVFGAYFPGPRLLQNLKTMMRRLVIKLPVLPVMVPDKLMLPLLVT